MRVRYDFILGRTIPLNTVVYPALFTLTVLTCLALFWALICHNIKEFYLFLFFYSTATRNRASEMFGTGIVLASMQREDLHLFKVWRVREVEERDVKIGGERDHWEASSHNWVSVFGAPGSPSSSRRERVEEENGTDTGLRREMNRN